ncbi:MAG TPA: WbqC family protein, partial [bacterium]|nr:WbqC family protein [bacterium]
MAERIVTIHQPQYLPWLGLVQKICDSDVFVVLDTVPYSRNYFYNRNRVRTAQGWTWLTIPVLTKGKFGQPFSEVAICDDTDWRKKHWATLRQSYAKAPHFRAYELSLAEFYTRPYARLLDAACDSMRLTLNLLGVEREILL